ncbi:exocyst complex component exo84, partial [Serendipita sp. 399]
MQSLRTRRLSTQDRPNERRQPAPSESKRSRGQQQQQRQQAIREDEAEYYDQGQPQARPRPNPSTVPREMRKSRVDDRIRRRMSTWYTEGDNGQQQGSIPDVPALPKERSGYSRGARDTRTSAREIVRDDPRAVDVDILQQDNFDPDAYLKLKLTNSTEAELKALQASLVASKSATAADL